MSLPPMARLDTSRWNLESGKAVILPLTIAITACGPVINLEGSTDSESDTDEPTDTNPPDTDPPNPSGPTDPDPPNPDCNYDSDCGYGYQCIGGACYPDEYYCSDGGCCDYYDGGGCCYYGVGVSGGCCYYDECCYGDDGCYSWDCSYDSDCSQGEYCDAYNQCEPASSVIACNVDPFTASIPVAAGGQVLSLSFVDANGDAARELVIGREDGAVLAAGAGAGEPVVIEGSAGVAQRAVASGNIDGDGDSDLLLSSTDVMTYLGDGTGSFTASSGLGVSASRLTTADHDGDGVLDVIAFADLGAGTEQLVVLLGSGAATFVPPTVFDPGGPILDFEVSPPAGGVSDIVAFDGQSIAVWRGGEGGSTVDAYLWSGPTNGAVAIGDLSGDGEHDVILVVPQDGFSLISVWYGSDGNFFEGTPMVIAGDLRTASIADFTGDGVGDIYLAGTASEVPIIQIIVGAGVDQACSIEVPTATSAELHTIGDYNGDGRPDIARADDQNVIVYSAG